MTTHESEFEQRLAEYLGDELTPEERAAFEARLAADPAAAEQVRALEGARAALERLVPEDEAAARAAAGLVLPGRRWRLVSAVARYAAVVALAFGAGYAARGWQARPVMTGAGATEGGAVTATEPAGGLVAAAVDVTRANPHMPEFTRALLALGRRN